FRECDPFPCCRRAAGLSAPRSPCGQNRSDGGAEIRMKAPSSNIQTPKKLQISSSNGLIRQRVLDLGAWDLFGTWSLGFGILALGIGANLALFAILNELLLRPKPVANPDELWAIEPADSIGQPLFPNVCRPYYEAVRQHARVFKGIIGYAGIMPKLRSKEEGT